MKTIVHSASVSSELGFSPYLALAVIILSSTAASAVIQLLGNWKKNKADRLKTEVETHGLTKGDLQKDIEHLLGRVSRLENMIDTLQTDRRKAREWAKDIRDWRRDERIKAIEVDHPFPPEPPGYDL